MVAMPTVDEFATLSAIWILASNDETSLITYRGLRSRLHLPDGYDLESLIARHGELFRLGLPKSRLELWKNDMRQGNHLPAWIREADQLHRNKYIENLGPNDGFRSQFRAGYSAPKSEVAVIEWGLGHIERLRKAQSEVRAATAKSWQMWVVFAASVLGTIATVIAALYGKK